MRLAVCVLFATALFLVVGVGPASADVPSEDDKRASCSTREGPSIAYKGETWVEYRDNGKGAWLVTNVQAKIRSVNDPKIHGDNHITVQLKDFSNGKSYYYEFSNVADADLVLQKNVDPWFTVPKANWSFALS